ncbi:RNA polymerase sigma-70 factor [Paenibacillus sp. FSL W7-1287]|uniref:RNA polymerase sigma-70 factor n=1 Tax=Paenibacillus sp. FSL W7-1287 TaxID=2954538 RepID=UPI0030F85263
MQISNEEYRQLKPLLFSLGYRLLGSANDAEDMAQETFLKAYQIEEELVDNKKAYLCKMMTNRCLDLLKSARHKREIYTGPWNPEPLMLEGDPSEYVLQREGLSIAYLRMMEHLSPDERAVLLLREAFDFTYSEIAGMLDKKEDNCRKIFSRAKQRMVAVEGESLDYESNRSIILRFIEAFQMHNMDALLELISDNVTLFSDGGGKVHAAVRPIHSRSNVIAFLFGIISKAPDNFYVEVNTVNAQPAILIYIDDALQSVISFYIKNITIQEVYITLNPDKLPTLR